MFVVLSRTLFSWIKKMKKIGEKSRGRALQEGRFLTDLFKSLSL